MHVIVPKELNSTEFPGEDVGLCPTYYIIIMDLGFYFFFTDAADLSLVDLVIGVGGDGTLLHINSLFPKKVPLVIAFNLGSLGFVIIFRNAIHRTSN